MAAPGGYAGCSPWVEAQKADLEALNGLREHLAIEPPPDTDLSGNGAGPPSALGPPGGHRLRLAVAAAARDGDHDATAAIVREGARQGFDTAELVAVAEHHWPKPRLPVRAFRAGRQWITVRLRRLHRPRRRAGVLADREARP